MYLYVRVSENRTPPAVTMGFNTWMSSGYPWRAWAFIERRLGIALSTHLQRAGDAILKGD